MRYPGLFKISVSFTLFLFFMAGVLFYLFMLGNRAIDAADDRVNHTYETVQRARDIGYLTEGMLASQRGYIMTGQSEFLTEYAGKKTDLQENLASLVALTQNNAAQKLRVETIQRELEDFMNLVEKRAANLPPVDGSEGFLKEAETINRSKQSILSIQEAILNEEYTMFGQQVAENKQQREEYYSTIVTGSAFGIGIIFIFNAAVLYLMFRRAEAERFLKDSEDRFALAIEGTNDGIFDWNLKNDRIFFSRQFFRMLGEDRKSFVGTSPDFRKLIHPDDVVRVWQYIERYLHRETLEYSVTFRMRHATGRWVWINSRAKAVFDKNGMPLRMVGAHTDITYMKEYQERLKGEKVRAESTSRAKSDFLAHMSHEIRTPLTAISGISEIFQRNNANLDDKQKKLVATLHSSTMSLKDLINDVLDFSRIESGELELKDEAFRLGDLFSQVGAIMGVQAAEKGLSFHFDDASVQDADFRGDPLRLRQVLINLVGNAVKFTQKGGISVIAVREEHVGATYLKIAVKDTGIGIAEENRELIFDRFKQVDSSDARRYGGSGLGLSISRNLVNLMGGTIGLESELGRGSVFTVLIPWQETNDQPRSEDEEALSRKLHHRLRAAMSGENRILLVEDYEGNIVVVAYILEELGCTFDVAKTGIEALHYWKEKHYDMILMDVQLPEMDGFTATTTIRALEAEKNIPRTPIIGMTAHALIGDADKCVEAGMDEYLPKPIVEIDLKSVILRYLEDRPLKA